jgi:hypothetical protein
MSVAAIPYNFGRPKFFSGFLDTFKEFDPILASALLTNRAGHENRIP